ncbi:hypothetical protein ACLB2K_071515 [Fragaria x ananassa]
MYYPPPTEPFSDPFLSSSLMPEWYKFMTFVARSLLSPTTQTSKITHLQAVLIAYFCDKSKPLLPAEYYIFQAIRRAAIPQRLSVSSSIVFPAVITLLCIKSNVPFHGDDALALPVNPVDRVTIAKSAAQSGLYVESLEQTLLKKEIKLIVDKAMQEAVIGFRDYVGHQFYTFKKEMPAILREFHETLNGRGHIVKWAPQKEVLTHQSVGVFWTHSGWNSTLESICEGVPMICTPFFGDQMLNARYASDVWEVGMHLENGLERGEIERAIRSLMMEKIERAFSDQCCVLCTLDCR